MHCLEEFVDIYYGLVISRYEHLGSSCKNCAKNKAANPVTMQFYINGESRDFCRSISVEQILQPGDLIMYNKFPFNIIEVNSGGAIANSNYFIIRPKKTRLNIIFLKELLNQYIDHELKLLTKANTKVLILSIQNLKKYNLTKLQYLNLIQSQTINKYMWLMILFSLTLILLLIIVLIINGVIANLFKNNPSPLLYFLVIELLLVVFAGPPLIGFFVLLFKKNFLLFKFKRWLKNKFRPKPNAKNLNAINTALKELFLQEFITPAEYKVIINRIKNRLE